MDPATTAIVTALSTGALFVGKAAATAAVKHAYDDLLAAVRRRFSGASVEQLEQQPTSKARRDVVAEDLERAHVAADPDVVRLARDLIVVIEREAPDSARATGVDIGALSDAKVTFDAVLAGAGATGVRIDTVIGSELRFGEVRAGTGDDDSVKKKH